MPATAGRVRMPANNRVHSSAALQTHGIWQSAIGYDPYAPNKEDSKTASEPKSSANEPDADNPYNSYQGLLALARITNTNADEARGACKKCGRVGHLTFQCRNFLSVNDDNKDPEAIQAAVLSELDKIKGKVRKINGKVNAEDEHDTEEEEEEESDSSDSDADSEIERIIAGRYGKKVSSKGRSSMQKKMDDSDEDGSDSDSDPRKRKKRGRSKKRSGKRGNNDLEDEEEVRKEERRKREESSDEDNKHPYRRRKRMEKRRKRVESSDEDNERLYCKRKSRKEKRRRRSQKHSDDSDLNSSEDSGRQYEQKIRRSELHSDLDASGSGNSRVGRSEKRSKKKSRRHHHKKDK